jgi:hypothetical protein
METKNGNSMFLWKFHAPRKCNFGGTRRGVEHFCEGGNISVTPGYLTQLVKTWHPKQVSSLCRQMCNENVATLGAAFHPSTRSTEVTLSQGMEFPQKHGISIFCSVYDSCPVSMRVTEIEL